MSDWLEDVRENVDGDGVTSMILMANLVLSCSRRYVAHKPADYSARLINFFVETPWDLRLILFGENGTINHASLENPIERRNKPWLTRNKYNNWVFQRHWYTKCTTFSKNIKNNTLRSRNIAWRRMFYARLFVFRNIPNSICISYTFVNAILL